MNVTDCGQVVLCSRIAYNSRNILLKDTLLLKEDPVVLNALMFMPVGEEADLVQFCRILKMAEYIQNLTFM
jgi:hypothetical protein